MESGGFGAVERIQTVVQQLDPKKTRAGFGRSDGERENSKVKSPTLLQAESTGYPDLAAELGCAAGFSDRTCGHFFLHAYVSPELGQMPRRFSHLSWDCA